MTAIIALSILASSSNHAGTSSTFKTWQENLASKTSLSAKVSVQEVGGGQTNYTITLKKPNSLRVDKTDELIVGDGKEITVFNKKDNTFYKKPQNDDELRVILKKDEYSLFSGFFPVSKPNPTSTTDGASRTLSSETVKEVIAMYDAKGDKKQSFFVGSDNLVKRSQMSIKAKDKTIQLVFNAKDVVVGGTVSDEMYAFKAPKDSKEIDYQDLISSRWIYDLDEAKLIAGKLDKMIFIDFMADWCGPCKMMDANVFVTDEFKALGKKLVFCKVNIDFNPAIASEYKVEAIPNMFVVKADGSVVGSFLGYEPAGEFIPKLEAMVNGQK
jgi:thiol-disulfide isomerase/thioredoxin